MRIKINLQDNKGFYLEVEPYYTIYTVKKKIEHLFGIPSIGQLMKLKNDITPPEHLCLSILNLNEDDEIMISYGKELFHQEIRVYCKSWWGEYKLFYVKPSFKVKRLQRMVCDHFKLFYESVWLEFPGKSILDENLSLSDYNIGSHCLLHMETDKR